MYRVAVQIVAIAALVALSACASPVVEVAPRTVVKVKTVEKVVEREKVVYRDRFVPILFPLVVTVPGEEKKSVQQCTVTRTVDISATCNLSNYKRCDAIKTCTEATFRYKQCGQRSLRGPRSKEPDVPCQKLCGRSIAASVEVRRREIAGGSRWEPIKQTVEVGQAKCEG